MRFLLHQSKNFLGVLLLGFGTIFLLVHSVGIRSVDHRDVKQFQELAHKYYVDFDSSMKVDEYKTVANGRSKNILNVFKALYNKNNFSQVALQKDLRIPKLFHYIWLGIKLPDKYRPFLQSWIDKHPDWTFIFWVDNPQNYDLGTVIKGADFNKVKELLSSSHAKGSRFVVDVKNLSFDNRIYFDEARNYGERSDILKWEAVYRFGGTYLDVDFECFRPFDMLHYMYDFYTGIQPLDTKIAQLGAALYGAIPKHPILKDCVETIPQDRKFGQIVVKTGPIHFTKSFLKLAGKTGHVDVAFPASYFYPCDYAQAGKPYVTWLRPESFAVHHWAGSWLKKEGWARS
ncbi:hypothetical protein KAH94_04720 [bacterium]|nr:hypothetical protein [bacterium]